jgi:DNA-binding HxlR family transcriptional regulator
MVPTHYDCPCSETCPLNYALSLIGGKWKLQIICTLNSSGVLRFNAIQRKLDGISNTVLAKALKELEGDGLVKKRRVFRNSL